MNAIRIETTNACNLQCRMCPQSVKAPGVRRGLMDSELFKKILEQLAAFPENLSALFYLHICGEPLLHPKVAEFVRFAADKGFKPILTTNATLLTPQLAEKLIKGGLHKIEFSFEGIDAPTYESIRIGAKFETVWRNIDSFLAVNNSAGHQVSTELVVVDLPDLDPMGIRAFCERMAPKFDRVNLSGYFDWLGRVPVADYARSEYVGCNATETDLNVLWDGRVVPCCQDVDGAMVIGDFRHQCFLEIMMAQQRKALAERLRCGQLSGLPCERCSVPWAGRQTRRVATSATTGGPAHSPAVPQSSSTSGARKTTEPATQV